MKYFAILALTILAVSYSFVSTANARTLPEPKLIAVYFYADWCPNCKILSPEMEKARVDGTLDKEDILFVTFDLTDKSRIHQSILRAQALGLGDYMKAQGSATGYIAVLDAKTKEEKLRFTRDSKSGQILSDIQDLLNSQPSE